MSKAAKQAWDSFWPSRGLTPDQAIDEMEANARRGSIAELTNLFAMREWARQALEPDDPVLVRLEELVDGLLARLQQRTRGE